MNGLHEIRAARGQDAAGIAALLTTLGYPASAEETGRRLATYLKGPENAVFVAEVSGRIAGVISFHCSPLFHADGFLGRITSLVVAPDARRSGIGRRLVAAAEEFAVAYGCGRIEVTSGDHRPEAHAFYERLGYRMDCRRFLKALPAKQAG